MAKQRVSLTLDEQLLDKVDSEAGKNDLNRSQMFERVINSYFQRKGVDTAVVFCVDPENKAMTDYECRPVLNHVLSHLADEGVTRCILLTGNNREEIEDELGSEFEGMALDYVAEDEPAGTGAALRQIDDMVGNTFAAVNGHVITDVDLNDMLRMHRDVGNAATMALTSVSDPSNYGVARLKGKDIQGFVEKPDKGEEPSRLINAGTYLFEPDIFSLIERDSLEEVFESLAEAGELAGYIYGGSWTDISE